MEYSDEKRVMLLVDDLAQLAHPMAVTSHKWYPNLLRPQDQMRSGFSLVADRSRVVVDLTGIPADDRWGHHDFACTRIVKAVRRFD